MVIQSTLLLQRKSSWFQNVYNRIPHQISMQLLYSGLKKLLRYIYAPESASFLAKVVILALVRRDYRKLFIIQFVLEYIFKYFFYSKSQKEQEKIYGPLTHLSMGFAAVSVSGGRKRVSRAFQAVAGVKYEHLAEFCIGQRPYFRPNDSTALQYHSMLYVNTLKKSLVPLILAVGIPSFLFEYIAGRPMDAVLYHSVADFRRLSMERLNAQPKSHFSRALRRALRDMFQYGLYLFFGLNSYMQVLEMHWFIFRRKPTVVERFIIGSIGGWPWIFIPKSKVLAYNHWAFTTVIDSLTSEDYIISVI